MFPHLFHCTRFNFQLKNRKLQKPTVPHFSFRYGEPEWIVNKERSNYDILFDSLSPIQGKLSGATVKEELVKSKLPNAVLAKIWKLSDVDRDGYLDKDEFALAMHLINVKLQGNEIPEDLPRHLVPPAKKERLYSP